MEVLDPLTVRFHTKGPYAPLLTYLTNIRSGTQIVPKKIVQAMGDEAFGRHPVGTGPMKIKDWKSGDAVELESYAGYFRGAPAIAGAHCPLIAEESSGLTAVLGKQVDFSSAVPFAAINTVRQNQ